MELMDLLNVLRQHHHPKDAAAMSQYMRQQFIFIGIKAPQRRQLAQPYFKQESQRMTQELDASINWSFVDACWQAPEREFQALAADYLKLLQNYLKADDLEQLKKLITWKSWWDSVDSLVKIVGQLAHQSDAMKVQLLEWSQADNLWLRRTAILHQLGMKTTTDTDLLTQCIENNLNTQEFFINKATGWALRDYAKCNETWVRDFLLTHESQLAPLSWREASKHLHMTNTL